MTDDERDTTFAELVAFSWKQHEETFRNERVDDVFLGAVIASQIRSGYALIGLNSDGVHHHLRFENLDDQTRLAFRLSHLSEDMTVAKVRGHLGSVIAAYGERPADLAVAWTSFEAEAPGLFAAGVEPGVVSFGADHSSGYLYAQITLLLDLDRYIREHFDVDLDRLQTHLGSVTSGLRKVLRGRLGGEAPDARASVAQRKAR